VGVRAFVKARDRLLAADDAELAVGPMCEEIVRAFHDVAVFDGCALMTTDPETLLPSGGVIEGFDADACVPFWDNELLDPDFNKFTQLARSHDPVATLVEAVDGDLERSPRYQKLYSALGVGDELRAAFVAGTACLGIAAFVRARAAGPFTPAEVSDARQLVTVTTTVLRRALGRMSQQAMNEPPVAIVLDASGEVTTMSAGGQRVLDDLRTAPDNGSGLPTIVRAAATKARWSRATTNLTTRMQGGSGRWVRLHVTPVEGDAAAVAVLIETARPDDLVRILLESYGLTHRETDIVRLLARGLSLKEIATELILSIHTVRDHTKAIYDKAGVNSRGELVATLFSNHVIDRLHGSVTRLTSTPAPRRPDDTPADALGPT
jgi:DNA-binding CsgD family transcriptional regulator